MPYIKNSIFFNEREEPLIMILSLPQAIAYVMGDFGGACGKLSSGFLGERPLRFASRNRSAWKTWTAL